jgi:hypothetical protein
MVLEFVKGFADPREELKEGLPIKSGVGRRRRRRYRRV